MGIAYIGYKLLRLMALAKQGDVLAQNAQLAHLDTPSGWVRAIADFSIERKHASPKLEWPETPLSQPTISRWLTGTFEVVDGEMRPGTSDRNRDEIRLSGTSDKVIDFPNRVTGALADCIASFITHRYRIGQDIFLASTLEAFNAGVERVYPAMAHETLRSLAEMSEGAELILEQDYQETQRIRLIVPGLPIASPEHNRLKIGLPFHAWLIKDSLSPEPAEGWRFALFNLRDDGDFDQFAPSTDVEPHYSHPAFTITAQRRQRVTPNVGVTAEEPEGGTLLLVAHSEPYPDHALLAEASLKISATDADQSFERQQLGRFAQWILHERRANRASIAIARFRCMR